MRCYDRTTGSYRELPDPGQNLLEFLYKKPLGRFFLKVVISRSLSRLYGYYKDSVFSAKGVEKFIAGNGIDMKDYEEKSYRSFNDFFTRKLKEGARKVDMDANSLISPCDSKLLVFDISDDLRVNIKGSLYTLPELTGRSTDLSKFAGGKCLVFRLALDDFHRFAYPDDGSLIDMYSIEGKLHTVRSIADDYNIYKENRRSVSILDTAGFGRMIMIEVGAMFVGRIRNHGQKTFKRGEEKGYFELGGSTVVVLLEGDRAEMDEDIISHSKENIETVVKFGERIGKKVGGKVC